MIHTKWIFALVFILLVCLGVYHPAESLERVYTSKIAGIFNPVLVEYLNRSISIAQTGQADYLLLLIDTPGGLEISMREMIQQVLHSPIPVIAYVYPTGARAASAGSFLVISAHHAFMTPGTTMGAASPITIEGETAGEKIASDAASFMRTLADIRNRNPEAAETMVTDSVSYTATEALEQGLIDGSVWTVSELLQTLGMTDPLMIDIEMTTREKFFHALSNPSLAYILLLLGGIGLFLELSNPGAIVPGVFGGLGLILAFYAFSILPVNIAGIIFIFLGLLLLALDLWVTPGIGVLTAGGGIALFLGSFLLFENVSGVRLPVEVIILSIGALLSFFIFALGMAMRTQRKKVQTGIESLLGKTGLVQTDLNPRGFIQLDGELWMADSPEPIQKGETVIVVKKEGPRLQVRKKEEKSNGRT